MRSRPQVTVVTVTMLIACTCSSPPSPHPEWATVTCHHENVAHPIAPGTEFNCPYVRLKSSGGDFRCPGECELYWRWPDGDRWEHMAITPRRPEFVWHGWIYRYERKEGTR
jgi:hypothetical protein